MILNDFKFRLEKDKLSATERRLVDLCVLNRNGFHINLETLGEYDEETLLKIERICIELEEKQAQKISNGLAKVLAKAFGGK